MILPPAPPASEMSAQRAIAASALSRLTQADHRLCLAPQAVEDLTGVPTRGDRWWPTARFSGALFIIPTCLLLKGVPFAL